MVRTIIEINAEKCDGCGLCVDACHVGAIAMIDGKARLIRDDYCDGLGNCLPVCHADAITFVEREAAPYDEIAVKNHQAKALAESPSGCKAFAEKSLGGKAFAEKASPLHEEFSNGKSISRLAQWPAQIRLVPVHAPYFDGAKLLIAADCTAYAYGAFHEDFMKDHITVIGCPKLDDVDYSEKLTEIIRNNDIQSVTIVRMEVPCCGGLEFATKKALQASGKFIPLRVVIISIEGEILDR